MARSTPPPDRAFRWHDPRTAGMRLLLSTAMGVVVGGVLAPAFGASVATLGGWDAASMTLLGLAWTIILRADARETRRRAGSEDPGRTAVWVVVILSSCASLFAAACVLRQAQTEVLPVAGRSALVLLCLASVACSWLLTHSAYTLRYARLYYRDDAEGVGGLEFPGGHPPDDFDFAYFAFTLGMCFQVSDVTITSPTIRRTALVHAVISFAYNTAILALALNVAFGQLGPGS